MRIFIGPTEISGIASGLAEGFSVLGVEADVVIAKPHPFGYDLSGIRGLNGLWQRVGRRRSQASGGLSKAVFGLLHGLLKWFVLLRAVLVYDAFIFLFAKTITNTRLELLLLKIFGRKVIFIYVGSDIRPPYIGAIGQSFEATESALQRLRQRAHRVKQKVALHERYADYLVNSPSTAQFHQHRFINWFSMGVPRHFVCSVKPASPRRKGIRILHAPSKPLTKGTPTIIAIIERLRAKGYAIDLVMIQNMPNSVVLEELAQCDFIVDEMYSDTPMAIFATEAAYFGKPAVIGGYFAADVSAYMCSDDTPPSMFVTPDRVEAAIERLIVDVEFRQELGQRACRFVHEHWSPAAVAGRYLRLIRDDVPVTWWFHPENVRYVYGCGVASERLVTLLHSFVGCCELPALQLSHNPVLEGRFADLAAGGASNSLQDGSQEM